MRKWDIELSVVIIVAAVIMTIITLLYTVQWLLNQENYNSFDEFKENTEVIEGKVTDVKEENNIIFSDRYNLVINTEKGNSKMVEVTNEQFRNYQKGANVKFRIDTKSDNKVEIDLKTQKDVKSDKDLELHKKQKQ